MRVINCKPKKDYNKGFTMVEVIIVISIILILALIVLPNYLSYKEKAKVTACNIGCKEFQKSYHTYLILEEVEHTNSLFTRYLNDYGEQICPNNGVINYIDEKVKCSIHDDGEEESVPYL